MVRYCPITYTKVRTPLSTATRAKIGAGLREAHRRRKAAAKSVVAEAATPIHLPPKPFADWIAVYREEVGEAMPVPDEAIDACVEHGQTLYEPFRYRAKAFREFYHQRGFSLRRRKEH